jgi:transposase
VLLCVTMGGSQSRTGPAHLEARRARAVALVAQGQTQAAVARRLGVTREAVRQWVHAYRTGGPAALASKPRRKRGRVPLAEVAQTLARGERSGGPLTTSRVRELIERAHGVEYSASSVRAILRGLGYAYSREEGWRRREKPEARKDRTLRAG